MVVHGTFVLYEVRNNKIGILLKKLTQIIIRPVCILFAFALLAACAPGKHVQTNHQEQAKEAQPAGSTAQSVPEQSAEANIPGMNDKQEAAVADPLEPWNRMIFTFNDKVYFWALKPAIKGYNWAIPEIARKSIRNFFDNVEMPTRFVSSVLQLDIKGAGIELARFTINSTIGVAGLFDVAQSKFKLKPQEKDIGQTLGKYGIGEGFYIVWPFLGPSDARDTIGTASDLYLSPWIKVRPAWIAGTLGGIEYFNKASFDGAEYEELVNSAIEPYAALKNAYIQYRRNMVKEK